jgi:hypothetical protein
VVVKNFNQLTAFAVSAAEEAGFAVLDMEPLLVGRADAAELYWPMDTHIHAPRQRRDRGRHSARLPAPLTATAGLRGPHWPRRARPPSPFSVVFMPEGGLASCR